MKNNSATNMKKYEKPEMDITVFDTEDVITTSGDDETEDAFDGE